MLDDFAEIRLFLVKEGFSPVTASGKEYIHTHGDIVFNVNLGLPANQIRVTYPDYQYNRQNPLSNKSVCVDYTIDMSKSAGIAIYNITRFFEDICERAKRK
jgi:hypothetical protein